MPKVRLLFCGDYGPCRRFEKIAMEKGGLVLGGFKDYASQADLAFLNLEVPLCTSDRPIKKWGVSLKAHPDCIRAVKEAGFTAVSLANNHILDYDAEGLASTIGCCEKWGIRYCGAGFGLAEAQEPLVMDAGSAKVAIIAIAEEEFSIAGIVSAGAAPLDVIDNIHQIVEAREQNDIVVVSIHGGVESFRYPRPELRRICRYFVDVGAHAVICHHPHIAGAYEVYNGAFIAYSLGNLVFDHIMPPEGWNDGYGVVLTLLANGGRVETLDFEILPYIQSVEAGGVVLLSGDRKKAYLDELDRMRNILAVEQLWLAEWDAYCRSRESETLTRAFVPLMFRGMARLMRATGARRWLVPWFLPKGTVAAKLNTVRCASHREILIYLLESKLRRQPGRR